jgi:hypothetical protein
MSTDTKPTPPPEAPTKPERGPLDPIERPLWRLKRPARRELLAPFIDQQVRLDRWSGRIAALGDQEYRGTLLAVATTTIGSASDLAIIKTVDGTVWAISTAQIAYLELLAPPKPRKVAAATTKRTRRTATSST